MSCHIVVVEVFFRVIGDAGPYPVNSNYQESSCIPGPYSFEFNRADDGFFIVYPGGREKLEGSWTGYEYLGYEVISDNPCEGCVEPPPENESYDCVNTACVKASVYNTPGFYSTLEECEIICGPGCGGKCLSNKDWERIKGLSKQLKNKNCG